MDCTVLLIGPGPVDEYFSFTSLFSPDFIILAKRRKMNGDQEISHGNELLVLGCFFTHSNSSSKKLKWEFLTLTRSISSAISSSPISRSRFTFLQIWCPLLLIAPLPSVSSDRGLVGLSRPVEIHGLSLVFDRMEFPGF